MRLYTCRIACLPWFFKTQVIDCWYFEAQRPLFLIVIMPLGAFPLWGALQGALGALAAPLRRLRPGGPWDRPLARSLEPPLQASSVNFGRPFQGSLRRLRPRTRRVSLLCSRCRKLVFPAFLLLLNINSLYLICFTNSLFINNKNLIL